MPEMQQRSSIASASASPFVSATRSPQLTSLRPDDDGDPHVPDSIPPWVHLTPDYEPPEPEPARPNTRHWKPPPPHNFKPGRKWDHLRSAEAPLLSMPIHEHQMAWKSFMQSGPNTSLEAGEGAKLMSKEWMDENMPITRRQWEESDERNVDKEAELAGFWLFWFLTPERRERTNQLFWRLLLKNPFVPLVFRIIVLAFAAAALGIAATIFETVNNVNSDPDPNNNCSQRPSTYMAVIVGAVALPYILFITWDEYTAKPLGLRSAFAKTSLILLDLIFIIMASSNLSLAFEALFDHRWACFSNSYPDIPISAQNQLGTCNDTGLCYKQKALTSVLFLSLVSWLITFSISVMRVVEKLRV